MYRNYLKYWAIQTKNRIHIKIKNYGCEVGGFDIYNV